MFVKLLFIASFDSYFDLVLNKSFTQHFQETLQKHVFDRIELYCVWIYSYIFLSDN